MRSYRYYCFFDESGDIALTDDAHVVSCVLVTSDLQAVNSVVAQTRQRHSKVLQNRTYLHAASDPPEVKRTLLDRVAQQGSIHVIASIFDKACWPNRQKHTDDIANDLVAYTLMQAMDTVGAMPSDTLVVVEQFHAQRRQNQALISRITEHVDIGADQTVLVRKHNTQWGNGVQIADAAAWSLFRKYERQDSSFWELIRPRIVHEAMVKLDLAGNIKPTEDFWK